MGVHGLRFPELDYARPNKNGTACVVLSTLFFGGVEQVRQCSYSYKEMSG